MTGDDREGATVEAGRRPETLNLAVILEDAGCTDAARLIHEGVRPQDLYDARFDATEPDDLVFKILEAWLAGRAAARSFYETTPEVSAPGANPTTP